METKNEIMTTQLGQRIVREIIERCGHHNEIVSQELAAFIIRIISTHPSYTTYVKDEMTLEEEDALVTNCCELILSKNNPCIDTVKMQVHYEVIYKTRDDFIKKHCKRREDQAKSIFIEITKMGLYGMNDLSNFKGKIITYFLLSSELGAVWDKKLTNEIATIIDEIIPKSELKILATMEEDIKRGQLNILTQIVTGIVIFNGRQKNGHVDINNVVVMLKEAAPTLLTKLTTEFQETKMYAEKLTVLLVKYILNSNKEEWSAEVKENLNLLVDILINTRQYETYLKKLMKESEVSKRRSEELPIQLENTMLTLHHIISLSPEPIQQCLPSFIALHDIWIAMQDEVLYLNNIAILLNKMHSCIENSHKLLDEQRLQFLLDNVEDKEFESFPEIKDFEELIAYPDETTVYFPVSIRNFSKLPLQFSGFCPWAVSYGNGALIPANRELGVVMYKEKWYGFSCSEAQNAFLQDPKSTIANVVTVAKRCPSLILFLKIYDRFSLPFLNMEDKLKTTEGSVTFTENCETQTDVHIIKPHHNLKYNWNEWDYRREALHLAKLRKKKTHSTQCDLSHFRRDNGTQTLTSKDNFCQTKRDASTTMSNYSLSNHIPL